MWFRDTIALTPGPPLVREKGRVNEDRVGCTEVNGICMCTLQLNVASPQ